MRHKVLVESFTRLSLTSQQHSLRNGILRYYSTPVQDAKPFKSIPGLSSLPVVGSLHHFLPVIGDFGPQGNFFKMAEVLHKKYGPLAKVSGMLFRSDMVMLFDPGHIEQVLRAQEANPLRNGFETLKYYRENYRKDKFERTYALSTAQGAEWREFRTKVNPALLKLKLVKVYAPPLEEIAQDYVARLKRLNDGTNYLTDNFLSEANRWSLESIAFVGFGARLGCLRDDLTPDHPASKLMKCAQDFLHLSYQLEYLPNPWRFVTTPAFKKIMQTFETQWQVSTMYIEQARNRIKDRGYEIPEEDQSIIERLLAIDERVAVMMANEMLFAGIDTVGFTITSMLYQLANNPVKQEKLREEIRSGDSRRRYLKACLKEATRLWPVTPVTLRTTDRDHYVGGFHIPPGVDILVPNEFLSRQEKYYPSPNEFIPERWLVDKTDPLYYGNAHPMVTLPFGFGIRSCIGRRIAELEIEMLFKNLIDEFKVTWEGPPIKVVNTILNSFEKPFNFKFVNAK